MGTYFRVGLYFGGAYIWNEVSVSTCGGLIPGGVGAYIRRAYIQRFTVVIVINNSDKQVGLYSGGGLIFGGLWNRDWVIKPTQCYWLVGQKKPIHI